MRRMRAFIMLPLLVVAIGALVTATGVGATDCKQIHAQFVQYQVQDCLSPVSFCSTAEIDSGLLKGTKTFTALGATPSAGLGTVEPASTFSYVGPVLIETDQGDVQVSFVGVIDTANGVFSELGRVQGGTGRFFGATGIVYVTGQVTNGGTVFPSTMTGEVCLLDS